MDMFSLSDQRSSLFAAAGPRQLTDTTPDVIRLKSSDLDHLVRILENDLRPDFAVLVLRMPKEASQLEDSTLIALVPKNKDGVDPVSLYLNQQVVQWQCPWSLCAHPRE